jgi:hypothetical protein
MDAEPSIDYSELLRIYDHARGATSRLGNEVLAFLERDEIYDAARRLGVLRQDTLVLGGEAEMAVLMDFAIRFVRKNGKNAIDRYLQTEPNRINVEDRDTLQRMAAAQYRILDVERVERGVGLLVSDRLRLESHLLVDRGMSITFSAGMILATSTVECDKFWMTTGAGLPMLGRVWGRLERPICKRLGKPGPKYRNLDRLQEADLATWCIRGCLESGIGERLRYQDARA